MISLSPRYDLFRLLLPLEFIPQELREKYDRLLSEKPRVITRAIDLLNESIQGISMPGISDLVVDQPQTSRNRLGHIEPKHDNSSVTVDNPLSKIGKEVTITFRLDAGFINYYLLYETIFHRVCKPENYKDGTDIYYDILTEVGEPICRVYLYQCHIDALEGLEFSTDKVSRESNTFSMTLKFNNIDIEFNNVNHL